jgi:hypothetical protein
MSASASERPASVEPEVIVIDATDDAAIRCECGAMVSPKFKGTGVVTICPICKRKFL